MRAWQLTTRPLVTGAEGGPDVLFREESETGLQALCPYCETSLLPLAERPGFRREVAAALRPTLCDAAGVWTADYVRLRFAAARPA